MNLLFISFFFILCQHGYYNPHGETDNDRRKTMKVILLMAITLDGRTGKDEMHFVDWTEQEDKKIFVQITRRTGVIIMGSRTFDTIGGPLPKRKNVIRPMPQV